jgi:hypothetical protein
VLRRIETILVDAEDDGDVLALRGCRDDDLLRAGVDVRLRLGGVGEQAGRFDDDLRAELLPGDAARIALGGYLDLVTVDDERRLVRLDGARIRAVIAVVLEQERVGRGVEQVVDGHDLDVVGVTIKQRFQDLATDAPKAVDAYANCHWRLLSSLPTRSNAARPAYCAAAPSSSSIRSNWLYLLTRSPRAGAPVLI